MMKGGTAPVCHHGDCVAGFVQAQGGFPGTGNTFRPEHNAVLIADLCAFINNGIPDVGKNNQFFLRTCHVLSSFVRLRPGYSVMLLLS